VDERESGNFEMIELAEGLWVSPEHVTMVKHVDENKCLLFLVGQSALEGHILPYAASEVAEAINDELDGGDYVDEENQEGDEDED
jgi:hypothetical protein